MRLIFITTLFFLCLGSAQAGWTKQNSGTFAWLHSIYFLNENKGWVAGSQGTFLQTTDNGKSWKQIARFTEDTIRDVYFADERNGWVLCEKSLFDSGSSSPSYLMRTADGGINWEKVEFAGGRERVARMFFAAGGYGYAVGESGALFAMRDDKKSWQKTPLPVHYLLLDGNFTDELHGTIVGGGKTILFTEDAGLTWNKATVLGQAETKLHSIFFVNSRTGWSVGSGGKIYMTVNAGRLWREQISGVGTDLFDIYFLNSAEGWAIGDRGTILHTTTAGNIWETIETGSKHKLERIFFAGKKGFAVGFGGTILTYDAAKAVDFVKSKPQLQSRTK